MDFDLTEEQRLLKESVDRFVADNQRDPGAHGGAVDEAKLWSGIAELGLLAVPFSEEEGGIGGGPVETMIVMEALGRGLITAPYLPTVVLGGGFLRLGGTEAQRQEFIPQIVDGSLTMAFAQLEKQSRYDLHDVATTAKRDGDDYVLDGRKGVVLGGDTAGLLVVTARTSGARRDEQGITLFLVDGNAQGVTRRGMASQDGQRVAEISFDSVRVPASRVLGEVDNGLPLATHVVDVAIAALCADSLGAMEELQHLTVEYLKTRQQFGVAIGSFQALQHRAADMLVAVEQARSMAMYAAMMAEEADARERRPAIAAAKAQVNRSARQVGQEAVQLHGGIAMTWEYKAGHYFKRLTTSELMFGDTDHHLRAVMESGGLVEEV
ncbi:acyl-CoA dehydrogenase family protein [Roseomonas xinghualingensis]|uniref:acyl-CoA dehydrogenase family protein n=1 Tax=Roseomonas xinghualingensis TaxID=2986475 RepID=UPI0021F1CEE1|nr:acyl-CoA dehydrogenase family protein [Roseomonas sp. SXEYE001]MCV4207403.1 acyl-CoA dehydrogenase family protein [Roseomonas sp. SXEYE001]